MDLRCLKLAQKPKGYYIAPVPGVGIRTLWVHSNGYAKQTHPSEYDALEWLVQRGCPLKPDASDAEKAEAKLIRDAWLESNGDGEVHTGEEVVQEQGKDISGQEPPPADEEYESVVLLPEPEVLPQEHQQPSDAPGEISLTSLTVPLEQCEHAQELETPCVSASSSPQTEPSQASSLRLPG
jgi:hypothetical protein